MGKTPSCCACAEGDEDAELTDEELARRIDLSIAKLTKKVGEQGAVETARAETAKAALQKQVDALGKIGEKLAEPHGDEESSTFFSDLGHHIDVFVDTARNHLKEHWMWYLIAMIIILIIALLLWHRKRLKAICKARRGRKEVIEEDPPVPVPLEI